MGRKLTSYRNDAEIPGLPDTSSVADEQTRLFLDLLKTGYESMRTSLLALNKAFRVDAKGDIDMDHFAEQMFQSRKFNQQLSAATGQPISSGKTSSKPKPEVDPDPDDYETIIVSGDYVQGLYNGTWNRGEDFHGKPSFYKTVDDDGETWTSVIAYADGPLDDWWHLDSDPFSQSLFGTHDMGISVSSGKRWYMTVSPGKKR